MMAVVFDPHKIDLMFMLFLCLLFHVPRGNLWKFNNYLRIGPQKYLQSEVDLYLKLSFLKSCGNTS